MPMTAMQKRAPRIVVDEPAHYTPAHVIASDDPRLMVIDPNEVRAAELAIGNRKQRRRITRDLKRRDRKR